MTRQTVSHAILGALYWVPTAEIDAHRVRERFTIRNTRPDFITREDVETVIPYYREGTGDLSDYLGVPIYAGEQLFPTERLEERLSDGDPFTAWTKRPDPNHPMAADGQEGFMRNMRAAVTDHYSALIRAETGTGKTVVGLDTIAELGRRAIILVPLTRLMDQWIEEAHDKLGLPYDSIGRIVGAKCQHRRPLVVGMMKSIAMREYPPEVYQSFGTMAVDEGHNTGAPLYAQTQGLFNSRYKFMLTATDGRRDGGDAVYKDQFGPPAFEQTMQSMPLTVHGVSYTAHKPPAGNNKSSRLIGLAYDFTRNQMITKLAVHWYEGGHYPLFIMDHTRHVEVLRRMFLAAGIPENKLGIYVGGEGGSPVTKEYLDWCEKHAVVFLATFGMMKEGIDIPKLDRGLNVSPRGDLVQTVGRIRRKFPGKDGRVHWVILRDRAIRSFEGNYFAATSQLAKLPNVTIRKATLDEVIRST